MNSDENDRVLRAMNKKEKQLREYEAENARLRKENAELQQMNENQRNTTSSALYAESVRSADVRRLEQLLKDARETVVNRSRELSALKTSTTYTEMGNKDQVIKNLNVEVAHVRKANDEVRATTRRQAMTIINLTAEIDGWRKMAKDRADENHESLAKLKEAALVYKANHLFMDQLEAQIGRLKADNEKLDFEITKLKGEAQKFDPTFDKDKWLAVYQKEAAIMAQRAGEQFAQQRAEIADLERKLKDRDSVIAVYDKDNVELRAAYNKVTAEMTTTIEGRMKVYKDALFRRGKQLHEMRKKINYTEERYNAFRRAIAQAGLNLYERFPSGEIEIR